MNLTHYFDRYFEIIPANTSQLIEEVLRLRYQVFCVETDLLRSKHSTGPREEDVYDVRSVHHLLRHKKTGLLVATARLILADPQDLTQKFPIEEYCGPCFYKNLKILKTPSRRSLAEISRFLISKDREKKVLDASGENGKNGYKRKDGLLCYLLLFGLFSAVIRMTASNKISNWYAGVDPTFHRLLCRFGISFTQIGPLYEYHGQRLPCIGATNTIFSSIKRYRPEVWKFLSKKGQLVPLQQQVNQP